MMDEDRILQKILEKGILSRHEIPDPEYSDSNEEVFGPRVDSLINSGKISAESVKSIVDELYSSDENDFDFEPLAAPVDEYEEATQAGKIKPAEKVVFAAPASGTARSSSRLRISQDLLAKHLKDAPPIKDLPVKNWDRYQFVSLLGEGGMGKVYKAYDPLLRRYVALKFIRGDDPELARRFIQEAQAQARVDHANVCRVYEVGEVEEKLYISMQYIEGDPLSRAKKKMELAQKVQVMRDVSEAVHAAHKIGLIHRDLKPTNIMIEKREDGTLHPYVMDFGLAREVENSGMTQSGMIIGTPWFMSPEQAESKRDLDHKTDVYGLGATLYDVLLGHPPFDGTTGMDVIMKVIHDEPTSLRKSDPQLPKDLDTIVLKALEKEPARRYETAHALANDLQRFLDDEPILARPATVAYKLQKKAKKYKALVAVGAVGIAVAFVLFGINMHTRYQAKVQARLANQFGSDVKEMENILRIAYMLPLHNTAEDTQQVVEKTQGIEKEMVQMGDPAYGPGNYALGRAALEMRQPYAAKLKLEEAWNSGYHEPVVAYALGRTLGDIYQIKLERARRTTDPELRKAKIQGIENDFLKPAVSYLQIGKKVKTESAEYVEALLAFYDKSTPYQEDLKKVESALNRPRWLYETKKLEGDIYRSIGNDFRDRGDQKSATENYDKARESYLATINVGRSDVIGYEGICDLENDILFFNLEYGKDPKPPFESAIDSCGKAIDAKPDSVTAHDLIADAYVTYSRYLFDHGEDPIDLLTKGDQHASASLKIDPSDYEAYGLRAISKYILGQIASYAGKDPRKNYNQSVADFQKALEHESADADKWINLGDAYLALARYDFDTGAGTSPFVQQTIDAFKKAIEQNPKLPEPYCNIGEVQWRKGLSEMSGGQDPRDSLKQAIRNLELSLQVNPDFALAHEHMGIAQSILSEYDLKKGIDPTASLTAAIDSYRKAIAANPDIPDLYNNLGEAYRHQIRYALLSGKDASDAESQALTQYAKAYQLNPEMAEAYSNEGAVHALQTELNRLDGLETAATADKAIHSFEKALKLNPQYLESYLYLSDVHWTLARSQLDAGQSPEKEIDLAGKAVAKALEIQADSSEALWRKGRIDLLRAEWQVQKGADSKTLLDHSRSELESALKSDPQDGRIDLSLAESYRWQSDADVEKGIRSADQGLAKNPLLAQALGIKAMLHLKLAGSSPQDQKKQYAGQALDELNQAVSKNSHLGRTYQPLIDEAKKILAL